MFLDQLFTLFVSLLEAEAVALVISCQAFIRPSRNLVDGDDTRFVERLAGIRQNLFIILPMEGRLTKSQITRGPLISNHSFLDGNKRIGMFVMLTFLEVNGIRLECTNEDVAEAGFAVAAGKIGYEDLLEWVKSHEET